MKRDVGELSVLLLVSQPQQLLFVFSTAIPTCPKHFQIAQTLSIRRGHSSSSNSACFRVNRLGVSFMAEAETASKSKGEEQPIKASEIDPKFKYELQKIHGSEKILKCFQCGTCTSDCPVARYSDSYRPRTLIHMAQLGLKDRVLNSDTLWLCAACFTCTDRCPQDVEVASVIRVFRNLATEKGCIPQVFKDQGQSLIETGYAYKIPELRIKKRESQGLPPLPKGNPDSVCKTLKGVKFFERIQKPAGERANGQ